jgi:hypothetical protein
MVHVEGPTPPSFREVLDSLFIYGDQSAEEIASRGRLTGGALNRKTVFSVLNVLTKKAKLVKRIPTGKRNGAKYHLPPGNYAVAVRRYGWKKERWPWRKMIKEVEDWHRREGDADARARYPQFLLHAVGIPLNDIAKTYLSKVLDEVEVGAQLDLVARLRRGLICIGCLNQGKGVHMVLEMGCQKAD